MPSVIDDTHAIGHALKVLRGDAMSGTSYMSSYRKRETFEEGTARIIAMKKSGRDYREAHEKKEMRANAFKAATGMTREQYDRDHSMKYSGGFLESIAAVWQDHFEKRAAEILNNGLTTYERSKYINALYGKGLAQIGLHGTFSNELTKSSDLTEESLVEMQRMLREAPFALVPKGAHPRPPHRDYTDWGAHGTVEIKHDTIQTLEQARGVVAYYETKPYHRPENAAHHQILDNAKRTIAAEHARVQSLIGSGKLPRTYCQGCYKTPKDCSCTDAHGIAIVCKCHACKTYYDPDALFANVIPGPITIWDAKGVPHVALTPRGLGMAPLKPEGGGYCTSCLKPPGDCECPRSDDEDGEADISQVALEKLKIGDGVALTSMAHPGSRPIKHGALDHDGCMTCGATHEQIAENPDGECDDGA